MRKYYQVGLVLTAALSFIALLFYRHEYNKLRFVLQVFNYFGAPGQKGSYINCSLVNNYNNDYTLPASTWQRLSDNIYAYSAYSNDDGEIVAIAVAKNINSINYSCYIYFDDSVKPINGKFSYKLLDSCKTNDNYDNDDKYCSYLFTCTYDNNSLQDKLIIGVEFLNTAQKDKNNYNVINNPIIQVHTLNDNINRSGSAVCVIPSTKPMKYIDMISFLAFHDSIGLNNFIIYDYGLSYIFNNALRNMAKINNHQQLNFTYTVIPWNFPYAQLPQNILQTIIEIDCVYRTYNKAHLAVALSWNEFINLKFHSSIDNVLTDFKKITGKVNDKMQLNTMIFCVNQNSNNINGAGDDDDDDDALNLTPIILKTNRRLKNPITNESRFVYQLNNIFSGNISQETMNDLVFINRYQSCYVDDRREITNGNLKFAERLPMSQIFQFYITGKLFSL